MYNLFKVQQIAKEYWHVNCNILYDTKKWCQKKRNVKVSKYKSVTE